MIGRTPTVLALRALGLGDALTGVPALRGLRRAFPDHRLVLAAPAGVGGWLRDLGVVDDVLPTAGLAPLRWAGPGGHVAVNLHGRGPQSHQLLQATRPDRLVAFAAPAAGHDGPAWRPDEHEVDRWCRLVRSAGGACEREDLRLDVGPDHGPAGTATAGTATAGTATAGTATAGTGTAGTGTAGKGTVGTGTAGPRATGAVVLHPGAASGSRRWPVDRWAAVAAWLVDRGSDVAVTGGPDEVDLATRVVAGLPPARARVLSGTLDLPGLAATVASARLLVCGDTGVAHVGTAVGTPSVLLFGPTPPQWWGPAIDVDRHTVLWHGDPARPGDPHGDDVDPALAAITTDEVVAAVERLLAAD